MLNLVEKDALGIVGTKNNDRLMVLFNEMGIINSL